MHIKPTVLAVVVTVLSAAAAWSAGNLDPDANCTDQADSQDASREPGRNVLRAQPAFSAGGWNDASTQNPLIPYGMFDESRLH